MRVKNLDRLQDDQSYPPCIKASKSILKSAIRNPQSTVLIVGQGLAGTAVAWRLWERGIPFLIVDPNEAQTCSKVAAGLVTPITGKRLNLSWRIAELLPDALLFYRRIEKVLGSRFYHQVPSVKLFKDAREAEIWETRRIDPELSRWINHGASPAVVDTKVFKHALGGFQQRHSGWLDTPAYLEASRAFFAAQGCWQQGIVNEEELTVSSEEVTWAGQSFSHAIFCKGWQQQGGPFFPWLRFFSARGLILTIKADLTEERILNHRCWLQPRGNGEWRVGSTYDFDFASPLEPWIEKLQNILADFVQVPYSVTNIQWGIRPVVHGQQITLGSHPAHPRIALLSGLGSKGVLRAPSFANMLLDHLFKAKPLSEEVDVAANN